MPDIHVPQFDEEKFDKDETAPAHRSAAGHSSHRAHAFKLLVEVTLISLGVFLGLAGEQWRESAHHRELAEDAVRRFRVELTENRRSVASVADYHVTLKRAIDEYLHDRAPGKQFTARMQGLQPASFDRTAWDLAIATQALEYMNSNLAYSLAEVYNLQERYSELSREVLQAMYINPPREKPDVFLEMLEVYYGDIVLQEPQLLKRYDALLATLGSSTPATRKGD